MKRTTLYLIFIFSAVQLATAQKIRLTYKVRSVDSLYVFKDNAYSDKKIQIKSDKLFPKNVISIEDDINRRFDKITFNHITYYPKLVNEGYFNLYELKVDDNPVYFICSKSDTLILEKKDSVVNQRLKKDRKYNGKLVVLCKDYPDLWEKAGKLNFKKEDFQDLISGLNGKYSDNNIRKHEQNRFDYLGFSLKGLAQKNNTDVMLDILMSHYFMNVSSDLSLRYGLRANYIQETMFFPALFTGWYYIDSSGTQHKMYAYGDHNETMTAKVFEIPVSVNWEITNSRITPYFCGGFSPLLYFRKITRTDSNETLNTSAITLNLFASAGIKLKLTNNFNVLSECSFDFYRHLKLNLGVEYFLKL